MADRIIKVNNVSKSFRTYETGNGFLGGFRKKYSMKNAIENISFSVSKGEIVALIGRNGSGKSTLTKMLSGILHPDKGNIKMLGKAPCKERIDVAKHIGIIFGSTHPQVFWDLPPEDTFKYIKEIYNVSEKDYNERLESLLNMLDLKKVYKRQTRQLSLGERMKCEFVAVMLYMPKVIIMDEATVGVDLPSRIAMGNAILEMRKKFNLTAVITTHVVEDISIADRLVLIDYGKKLYDGPVKKFKDKFANYTVLELEFEDRKHIAEYMKLGKALVKNNNYLKLAIKPSAIKNPEFIKIFKDRNITNYRVSDPMLSSILEDFYKGIDTAKTR